MDKQKQLNKEKEENHLSLAPLDFEEALSDMLKVKPTKNSELAKDKKKKSKPTSKK